MYNKKYKNCLYDKKRKNNLRYPNYFMNIFEKQRKKHFVSLPISRKNKSTPMWKLLIKTKTKTKLN